MLVFLSWTKVGLKHDGKLFQTYLFFFRNKGFYGKPSPMYVIEDYTKSNRVRGVSLLNEIVVILIQGNIQNIRSFHNTFVYVCNLCSTQPYL